MNFLKKIFNVSSNKARRFTAGFLALAISATTVLSGQVGLISSYADGATWTNEARSWPPDINGRGAVVNKWKAGSVYAFCIMPGVTNLEGLPAIPIKTTFANYREMQGGDKILSDEVYRKLSLLSYFYYEKYYGNSSAHVACQCIAWCLNGSVTGWGSSDLWNQVLGCIDSSADALASVINAAETKRIGREAVDLLNNYNQKTLPQGMVPGLKDCVITNGETLNSQWTQNNGRFEMRFDCSAFPQLKSVTWNTSNWPGVNYTWEGNTLVFWSYVGSNGYAFVEVPKGMYASARISETLTIYPGQSDDYQSLVAYGEPAYLYVGNPTSSSGGSGGGRNPDGFQKDWEYYQPTILRRKETFRSDYNFDLKKYCAETGEFLESSEFEIFEAFDDSQVGDGTGGTVGAEFMDPDPATWSGFKSRTTKDTDVNGYFEYSTTKHYNYDKTYCLGHPKPKLQTVPEPDVDEEGNVTNEDEIEWAEAVNEELERCWNTQVQNCQALADEGFHFHCEGDGTQTPSYEAQDAMIRDREDTYDTFINLKYQYKVKEIKARNGYILHDEHNDDEPIPVIEMNSSQGGAIAEEIANGKRSLMRNSLASLSVTNSMALTSTTKRASSYNKITVAKNNQPVVETDDANVVELEDSRIVLNSNNDEEISLISDTEIIKNATKSNSDKLSSAKSSDDITSGNEKATVSNANKNNSENDEETTATSSNSSLYDEEGNILDGEVGSSETTATSIYQSQTELRQVAKQ